MGRFHLAVIVSLCGCSGPAVVPIGEDPGARSIREQLAREYEAELLPLPASPEDVAELESYRCAVVIVPEPRVPAVALDAATTAALRGWVERGGKLLLLGFATRLVHELGIEPSAPDRHELYRWGVDSRTALGDYRYGFRRIVAAGLDDGLAATDDAFLLGGGELVIAQTSHWESVMPERGEVLGKLARVRDGEFRALDSAVLTRWHTGEGSVLALGNLPEPWRPDAAIADNARRFLRNALRALGVTERGEVVILTAFGERAGVPEPRLPPLLDRPFPGRVIVPHWGWHIGVSRGEGKEPISPQAVFETVVAPAARAGATLVEIDAVDGSRGLPFRWTGSDPLVRPAGFVGGGFWPNWNLGQVRLLSQEAHDRGMLASISLDPPPVRGGVPREQLAAAKWLLRELGDQRRFGDKTIDGIGVREWFDDPEGRTLEVVRAFQPGLHGYATEAFGSDVGGMVRVVDAEAGRPRGLFATGLSAGWRDVYPGSRFTGGILDCRGRSVPGATPTGGNYADWIATQLNDFARARIGASAAVWWRTYDPNQHAPRTLEYVHGLSLDPLRAAVAGRLVATGQEGYRDLQAARLESVQSGFGADSPLDASTPFIQNNTVRLHGSGGPLWYDPGDVADFRGEGGSSVELAGQFMITRVRNVRPQVRSLRESIIDFIGGFPRGEGGYHGGSVTIPAPELGAGRFPAVLARDDQPRWPRRVDVGLEVVPGLYAMELALLSRAGSGTIELSVDGELVRVFGFVGGAAAAEHRFALPLAIGGSRTLTLEVVDGGAVQISKCRIERVRDSAAEARIRIPAGYRAELAETSSSSYFTENARWFVHADCPAVFWETEVEAAQRNLEVVRVFGFRTHTSLDRGSVESGPFVLESSDPRVPDLAVVPVALPQGVQFRLGETGLELVHYAPRPHQQVAVGFVFLRDGTPELGDLPPMAQAALQPTVLHLERGASVEVPSVSPFPHARVVRVFAPERSGFLVRERGWWTFRGVQAGADGSVWLKLYELPDDEVALQSMAGGGIWFRPGPGSLHGLALRAERPDAVEVEVFPPGPLVAAPSIVAGQSFDAVTVDGVPWHYWHGDRIALPATAGRYGVELRASGRDAGPRLVRTRAIVRRCHYDATQRVLEIVTEPRPEDGPATRYFAWLTGPPALEVRGGEQVDDAELTYATAEIRAGAERAGMIVRFRAGLLRVRYP